MMSLFSSSTATGSESLEIGAKSGEGSDSTSRDSMTGQPNRPRAPLGRDRSVTFYGGHKIHP
jgi:hypothetical protein